ncbi:MAG: CBS domain-containing protein [Phaeodactylibacter sp.]|nr:CBS domain-containing protein [Phaeodactylibacter sp.]MCB9303545.1 CBS domain-containing protein [Lewinellaceae bacterium]HQU57840.1 CBS domain-containing protein [Saprospiraceae bacterium]
MSKFPSVTQYMTTRLVTFHPETYLWEAIETMLKKKISGAPVLNHQEELVGMLSEVDCLRILVDGLYNDEPRHMLKVGDYMSTKVSTISASKSIFDAANEFISHGFKRLPVIENGKLVGQISRVDVLKAVQEMKPKARHIPDTWKGREPALPSYKKTRHTGNS